MKLQNLFEQQDKKGTYAGVKFDEQTIEAISQYIKQHKIPNGIDKNKLHTTLLYSRKYLPNYKSQGQIDPPFIGTPTQLQVWESQPDENGKTSNCLVLKYQCNALYQRHKKLMSQHGATYDFDEYDPHITLSYDIGKFKHKKLPLPECDIVITSEYQEELDLSWAKNNT